MDKTKNRLWMLIVAYVVVMLVCGRVYAAPEAPDTFPLDEEAAQQLALQDCGIGQEDADRLYVKREIEDREEVIEVEFFCQDGEYEYVIRTEDGMILEWQVEGRDVGDASAELSLTGNTQDEAGTDGPAEDETAGDAAEGQTEDSAADGQTQFMTVDGTALIGLEKAKDIVRKDSGNAEDLTFTKIHFEHSGRFYEYELEIYVGNREYEYLVDAQTGEILRAEMDD